MSFYNTGNPVPSIDPRDLDDNAKHIDELTNSTFPTFVDRLGTTRRTLAGIEADADAVTLRSDLIAPDGATLIGTQSLLAGAIYRTLDKELSDSIPITRFGAVAGVDCADAIIAAATVTTGVLLVPPGAFVATSTAAKTAALLAVLKRIRLDGTLTINLASGLHSLSATAILNSPDSGRIQILGPALVSTTLTSQVSVSGAAKNYSVTLGVASTAGIAVGDFASIRTDVTGTGGFYPHGGAWRVTAIGAGSITVTNTYHGATFPTNTVTGGSVKIVKARLKFTGCDAFRFESASPPFLDRFTIEGDWDVFAATGTMGAHGIVMAAPVITGGGSSNAVFSMAGNASLGDGMTINCFGEQGVAVSGRCGLVANFVPSCSHRKRSWYAEGGHIRAKFSIGAGSGEDSYISDTTGFIQAAGSWASGAGLNSFWGTNGGVLLASGSVSYGPLGHGYEQRGSGRVGADSCKSYAAGISGYRVSDGGMMDADNSLADASVSHNYDADINGTLDANNCTSTNSGGYSFRSQYASVVNVSGGTESGSVSGAYFNREALLIGTAGASIPQDVPTATVGHRFYNPTKTHYWQLTLTSIGDMALSFDGVGKITLKNDGTWQPATDGGAPVGTTALKFSQVNAIVGRYTGAVQCGQFTLATLPNAVTFSGYEIDVTDATGGSKRCRSNGTVWQILNTTTTVS